MFCRTGTILLYITISTVVVTVSTTSAAQHIPTKKGTAADFIVMYPWMMVGFVVGLFAVLAWFVKKIDDQREKKIDQVIRDLANTVIKLDATINTLFDHDRDIEREVALQGASIASLQATCEARGRMCPLVGGGTGNLVCLERRDGQERRHDE